MGVLSGLAQRSDRTVRSHQALAELTGDSRTWNQTRQKGPVSGQEERRQLAEPARVSGGELSGAEQGGCEALRS